MLYYLNCLAMLLNISTRTLFSACPSCTGATSLYHLDTPHTCRVRIFTKIYAYSGTTCSTCAPSCRYSAAPWGTMMGTQQPSIVFNVYEYLCY